MSTTRPSSIVERSEITAKLEQPKPLPRSEEDVSPPEQLKIWLYVHRGRTYANRLLDFQYPGDVKVESYSRRGNRVTVVLQSTFNRSIRWELILPQREGTHTVYADLRR